jgi:ribosomal protein S27E
LVREKGRFKAEGVIKCKYCGTVMEILPQLITVELEGLYCRQCDGQDFLLDIERLQQADKGFEFSVFLDCKRCAKRFTFFKRTKRAVRSVKCLKLSLTGVEFEFFSPGDEPEHDVQLRTYRWSEYSKLPPKRRLP